MSHPSYKAALDDLDAWCEEQRTLAQDMLKEGDKRAIVAFQKYLYQAAHRHLDLLLWIGAEQKLEAKDDNAEWTPLGRTPDGKILSFCLEDADDPHAEFTVQWPETQNEKS